MTDELKNATCSGCGEQVLIEANGQKDGFCACDPTCFRCGRQFVPWRLDSEGQDSIVPISQGHICEDCYVAFRDEYVREHRMQGLWENLTKEDAPLYSAERDEGYRMGMRLARYAFELHVRDRAEDEYWRQ